MKKLRDFYNGFVREPLALFATYRIPLFVAVYIGLVLFPHLEVVAWRVAPNNLFFDGWFRWDSGWYLSIAKRGYTHIPNEFGHRDTNFWPLLPVLTRIVAWLLHDTDLWLSMFFVTNVSFFIAVVFFFHLAKLDFGDNVAKLSTSLLLVYPYSFYYSAGYTESIFLMATVGAFYFGRKEKWLWAGIFAAVASGSRAIGLVTPLALGIMYLASKNWNLKRLRFDIFYVALGALGFLGYIGFLALKFHDPFAWTAGYKSKGWGADFTWGMFLSYLHGSLSFHQWLDGTVPLIAASSMISLVVYGIFILFGARRLPVAYTVWGAITFLAYIRLFPICGRYVSTSFPMFLSAGLFLDRHPRLANGTLVFSSMILVMFAAGFSHWLQFL